MVFDWQASTKDLCSHLDWAQSDCVSNSICESETGFDVHRIVRSGVGTSCNNYSIHGR